MNYLAVGLTIGLFGGWILRMVFDRNEREKTAAQKREAYCLRRAAHMDAEFVERVLLVETKQIRG